MRLWLKMKKGSSWKSVGKDLIKIVVNPATEKGKSSFTRVKKSILLVDGKKEKAYGRISVPRISSEGLNSGDIWRSEGSGYPT